MISVIPVVFDQIGAKVDIDGHWHIKWMSRHHIGRYEPSGMHVTFLVIWIWLQCERVDVPRLVRLEARIVAITLRREEEAWLIQFPHP